MTAQTLTRETNDLGYQFRLAMRRLAGGVSIITAGKGEEITGMTVTSLTSFSADPPRLLVNINRQASSFPLIARHRSFGVNILGADQREIADRFSNGRFKGKERFDGVAWTAGTSGVPLLGGALTALECEVDEIIERYSHGIVVGRLVNIELSQRLSGLVYWNAAYVEIGGGTIPS
ncbi:flavin reductase family protein [Bradyrhizobium sp. 142]|uniref:flavin reductase family protein n=1 Tax=Bradyrhizobium sp. 142 TaxID=2782618 RepID=UPI001FFBD13D|nr:flavin reductase family protein [Bradyrhizobium sp. 142]MCK1727851.1 flavin reductase family protein [Bradyrhizobium sp. 142]